MTFEQAMVSFLTTVAGRSPAIESIGTDVRVATCSNYPSEGQATYVTIGASAANTSMWRGVPLGVEVTLTLSRESVDLKQRLIEAVMENTRVAATRERRPFIEENGVYSPHRAPHLLFSSALSVTPALGPKKALADRFVSFIACVPLDDDELRIYEQGVPALIKKLRSEGNIAQYPRK